MTREEFMDIVYSELYSDSDNYRANRIIDAADEYAEDSSSEKPNKWIPVSERLPEKNGQYLVTVKKGYMLLGLWCGIKDDWRNVIAWMPLPEPYKASSTGAEDY